MFPKAKAVEFTSRTTRWETVAAIGYLPIHLGLMPLIAQVLLIKGLVDVSMANFVCYAVGALFMLLCLGRFLRRDFDPLCDRLLGCALEIVSCYFLMMCFNLIVNLLLGFLSGADLAALENPNNQAVFSMADESFGMISAMTIFLAPIVEECMFRAGVFGALRRYNRTAAYIASMLLFSVYHVWSYAIYEPSAWIFVLQYLPVSWLLCRCYERCNSIWGSIFLHMLINGISMQAMQMLGELM